MPANRSLRAARTAARRAEALRLRSEEGLSYGRIAERMGTSRQNAYWLLRRATPESGPLPEAPPSWRDPADAPMRPSRPMPAHVAFGDDPAAAAPDPGHAPSRPLMHSPCSASAGW